MMIKLYLNKVLFSKNKKVVFFLLILFVVGNANAQQLPSFSQYKLNYFMLNPAASGSEGYTGFNLTVKDYWMGLSDINQRTYVASGEARLLKRNVDITSGLFGQKKIQTERTGRVGIGGFLYNDQNGAVSRTGGQFAYAYHIDMGDESQLSFGLAASFFQFKIDKDNLVFGPNAEDNEINFSDNKYATFHPDFAIGAYWMAYPYYIGVSCDQLLQSVIKFGKINTNIDKEYKMQLLRQYYLMGGYQLSLSDDFAFEPSLLFKINEKRFVQQIDITGKFLYRDQYWGGIAYRTLGGIDKMSGALVVLGGVKVNEFFCGVSWDYALNSIRNYNLGTFELLLAVRFGSSARKYKWKDRF
jgi:type IX secretion system PorP/SprF family membrane protein